MNDKSRAFWKDVGRAVLVLIIAGVVVRFLEREVLALPPGEG